MTRKSLVLLIFVLVSILVFSLNIQKPNSPSPSKTKVQDQPWERPPLPKYFPIASNKSAEFTIFLSVLTYHYVRVVPNREEDRFGADLSVTPENFEAQAAYLVNQGYHTIAPGDLLEALENHTKLPPKSVILTFDDGYRDFYTNAFPILKKYNLKATAFIVPGFLSDSGGRYLAWDELKEIDASGLITIAAHTMHHVDLVSNEHREEEVKQSKKVLENFLGHQVDFFAYPYGYYDSEVVGLVENAGFKLAFTTKSGKVYKMSEKYFLPRTRISGNFMLEKFIERLDPTVSLSKTSIAHSKPKS